MLYKIVNRVSDVFSETIVEKRVLLKEMYCYYSRIKNKCIIIGKNNVAFSHISFLKYCYPGANGVLLKVNKWVLLGTNNIKIVSYSIVKMLRDVIEDDTDIKNIMFVIGKMSLLNCTPETECSKLIEKTFAVCGVESLFFWMKPTYTTVTPPPRICRLSPNGYWNLTSPETFIPRTQLWKLRNCGKDADTINVSCTTKTKRNIRKKPPIWEIITSYTAAGQSVTYKYPIVPKTLYFVEYRLNEIFLTSRFRDVLGEEVDCYKIINNIYIYYSNIPGRSLLIGNKYSSLCNVEFPEDSLPLVDQIILKVTECAIVPYKTIQLIKYEPFTGIAHEIKNKYDICENVHKARSTVERIRGKPTTYKRGNIKRKCVEEIEVTALKKKENDVDRDTSVDFKDINLNDEDYDNLAINQLLDLEKELESIPEKELSRNMQLLEEELYSILDEL